MAAAAVAGGLLVAVSGPAQAASPPDPPAGLLGAGQNQKVVLSWTAPVSNGGAAISDYVVQYKLSSGSSWSVFGDGVSAVPGATVTGLTNGSAYSFQVAAVNSAGTGSYSAAASATPDITVPSAPTSLTTTAGNAKLTLSWALPAERYLLQDRGWSFDPKSGYWMPPG